MWHVKSKSSAWAEISCIITTEKSYGSCLHTYIIETRPEKHAQRQWKDKIADSIAIYFSNPQHGPLSLRRNPLHGNRPLRIKQLNLLSKPFSRLPNKSLIWFSIPSK